jgi:hypothetical protein
MNFVGDVVILPKDAVVLFINKADRDIYDYVVLFDIIEKR